MVALTNNRSTVMKAGEQYSLGVGAAQRIFQGALVCRNATGFAVKGSTSTTLKALGSATAQADNTSGADGAIQVPYRSGCFKYANSAAGDLIVAADAGNDCFIVDDQTVAKTNGGATRSIAGKIDSVDPDGGVWVWIGVQYQ
jgi:hypothetical protein